MWEILDKILITAFKVIGIGIVLFIVFVIIVGPISEKIEARKLRKVKNMDDLKKLDEGLQNNFIYEMALGYDEGKDYQKADLELSFIQVLNIICWFNSEVNNGGLQQFLDNRLPEGMPVYLPQALEKIKARKTLAKYQKFFADNNLADYQTMDDESIEQLPWEEFDNWFFEKGTVEVENCMHKYALSGDLFAGKNEAR